LFGIGAKRSSLKSKRRSIVSKYCRLEGSETHETPVECLLWIYDGSTLISGGRDASVRVWDSLNNFALLETIQSHKAAVLCLAFCQDLNMLATAGRDSTIKLWDASSLGKYYLPLCNVILDVFFREKRSDDSSIKVTHHANLDSHRGDVTSLLFSPKENILFSGARDNEIKVWNLTT
jgi:WD40 repeat protein